MKYFAIFALLLLPILSFGAQYQPLVGIPNVDPNADFSGYIESLYIMSISIAGLLAVFKIIIAGIKWMMTDIVTSKSEAKKDIQGALIGLLVVLGAVLILTVINPDLVKVDLRLDPAPTPTLQKSRDTEYYALLEEDMKYVIPSNVPEAKAKELCLSRSETLCEENRKIGCYEGEYYQTNDEKVCVIRENNLVKGGEEFDCEWISSEPQPLQCSFSTIFDWDNSCSVISWDLFNEGWDCSAAQAKCSGAGLDYDTDYVYSGSVRQVECEWP